jgi:hypothetical protein
VARAQRASRCERLEHVLAPLLGQLIRMGGVEREQAVRHKPGAHGVAGVLLVPKNTPDSIEILSAFCIAVYGVKRLWCMNRGNANEINMLRFSTLNRKT